MKLFDKTWKLAVSGAVIGLLVMLLAIYGNPANMAICVACFIRDTAGRAQAAHCGSGAVFPPGCRRLCLRLVPARPADEGIQVHRRFFADGALYPRRRDDDRRARIPRLSAPHGAAHVRRRSERMDRAHRLCGRRPDRLVLPQEGLLSRAAPMRRSR